MSQSRKHSLEEAVVSTFVGFLIAWVAQAIICWVHDIPLSGIQNAIIVFWMTILSIIRTYLVRRWYNRRAQADAYFESGVRNDG